MPHSPTLPDRLLRWIGVLMSEPRLRGIDVDSTRFLQLHREILLEKPTVRDVFADTYSLCLNLDRELLSGEGLRLEIGAGVSFLAELTDGVFTSDIKPAAHLDLAASALALPVRPGSVRAIFGLNCFHHFDDPELFFSELQCVLEPGGGCILIEPYYGPIARCLYPRLFASEGFDMGQSGWRNDSVSGVMTGANQALSYVVFVRDRERLTRQFPDLELVLMKPLQNHMRYLLSGGLNFRPLLPSWAFPSVALIERLAAPLAGWLALHHVIVLRKRPEQQHWRAA